MAILQEQQLAKDIVVAWLNIFSPSTSVISDTLRNPTTAGELIANVYKTVVVKYVGDTFLNLSYEKQSAHPDKKGSPVPPEGPQRKCLSAGRVESVAV